MEKFKKFIGKPLRLENIKEPNFLKNYSFLCQSIPEKIEEFGELNF